jgi:hypothetical protein
MPPTTDLLIATWQAETARALGVHKHTVQDWRQGRMNPQPGGVGGIVRVALQRVTEIQRLLTLL